MAVYRIPSNFIEGGKIFGGSIKLRNFIEGIILGVVGFTITRHLPIESFQVRITLMVLLTGVPFFFGVIGWQDDPLSIHFYNVFTWMKQRTIMLYNNANQARTDDIVERMMEQQTAQEKIAESIKKIKPERDQKERKLVEGVDFVFETDSELTKYNEEPASASLNIFRKKKNQKDIDKEVDRVLAGKSSRNLDDLRPVIEDIPLDED